MKVQWQLVPVSLSHRNTKLNLSQGLLWSLFGEDGCSSSFLCWKTKEFSLYATLGSHGSLSASLLLSQMKREFCFLFHDTLKYNFLESYSRMLFPKYHIMVCPQKCPDQKPKATVRFLLRFSWYHSSLETGLWQCRTYLTEDSMALNLPWTHSFWLWGVYS